MDEGGGGGFMALIFHVIHSFFASTSLGHSRENLPPGEALCVYLREASMRDERFCVTEGVRSTVLYPSHISAG